MTQPDAAPGVHQPLEAQLAVARLELNDISSGLWLATGYNQDPIAAAIEAFPKPERRRSDTQFECAPEEEVVLRERAATLGPGRAETESLEDIGIYRVDAEAIEPGQLHKSVTEIWRALVTGGRAPMVVFASDRNIPKWKKDAENETVDAERLSTDRLLVIGGQGLATSADFFYRAGEFDAEAKAAAKAEDADYAEARQERALDRPDTEYDATEAFLGAALDEIDDTVLPIGYDPETGQVNADMTGQVRHLGTISGRDIIFVHKEPRADGSALDTTDTILLMGDISSAVTRTPETTMSYWTSSTYKPSRWMSGIRAGIKAAQRGDKLRVAVPTYGYVDLAKIKGGEAKPPTIQNIASEMGKAAHEAAELREFIGSFAG